MARADLILNLVGAATRGDQASVQKTVEALAAEERAKNHDILADRLITKLRQNANGHRNLQTASCPQSHQLGLVSETVPQRRVGDLILPREGEEAVLRMIEEQQRVDLLRSYGLEPRNRVLLAGPPGNGKTSLAEAIAYELNFPLLSVRYEGIIGSYLGETAQRIRQMFEHVRTRHCVLFFDEFDVVGKERGDAHETGEIKRVSSSLLLQIDSLPSHVVVVTASNHPELLDRAVWRRFQIRLELPMPRKDQIKSWFLQFEERSGHSLGVSPDLLVKSFEGLSFAEMEDFGFDVLRQIALKQADANPERITKGCLNLWKKRFSA
jgi:SpoVK/Ycf46/Vps4 family AAA+-type ATPase